MDKELDYWAIYPTGVLNVCLILMKLLYCLSSLQGVNNYHQNREWIFF